MAAEPASSVLGIKYGAVVAGFFGAVLYLAHTDKLTFKQMTVALFTGTLCSAWVPPLITSYIGLPSPAENAIAFLVGLTGMSFVAGVLRAAENFGNNPLGWFKK